MSWQRIGLAQCPQAGRDRERPPWLFVNLLRGRGVTARGRETRAAVGCSLITQGARMSKMSRSMECSAIGPAGSDEVSEPARDGDKIVRFRPKVYKRRNTA
jgi:hypothetical protein